MDPSCSYKYQQVKVNGIARVSLKRRQTDILWVFIQGYGIKKAFELRKVNILGDTSHKQQRLKMSKRNVVYKEHVYLSIVRKSTKRQNLPDSRGQRT